MLVPVILAGGVGARPWLVSRESYPKPFVIIEMQTGDGVEEDDSVRFDDVYGRT
jgi:mannose-1-phosphate guanylyltransferase